MPLLRPGGWPGAVKPHFRNAVQHSRAESLHSMLSQAGGEVGVTLHEAGPAVWSLGQRACRGRPAACPLRPALTHPAQIVNCTSVPSDQPETVRSTASMVLTRCGEVTQFTAAISC
jgi:hypothetical protein